jgi:urea transport system ATP-binding protein
VLQNLDIAAGARRRPLSLLRRRAGTPAAVEQALETVGLTGLRDTPAGVLAHGQKQWLEIGMLLVQDAHLLLLDEPVAGMTQAEREETGALLRRIGSQRVVVVVEHDMEFLRSFADSVTVMHQGSVLAEGTVAEVQNDPAVVQVYLGADASSDTTTAADAPAAAAATASPAVTTTGSAEPATTEGDLP